jgi:endonuclease YncB( thermonuclease family)
MVMGVLDGDSFKARIEVWPGQYVQTTVRLAGVDAPELRGKCENETRAAKAAQLRLAELLTDGKVTLSHVKPDKYASRVDAMVYIDGRDVGAVLMAEGKARYYDGRARGKWCP